MRSIVIGLVVLLSACSNESPKETIAAARESISNNDLKSATVHLKNMLEMSPTSGEARFLLGKTLLESGDFRAAEVELRKSKEYNYTSDDWAPMLARALLEQRQFKRVIDEFKAATLTGKLAQANLNSTVALAYAAEGRRDHAMELVESNLKSVPEHSDTLLLKARMLARPGSLDEAIALVDKVIESNPRNPAAWQLSGDLQVFGKRNLINSIAAYKKVLELRNDSTQAHSSIIFVHLAKNDVPAARKQLDSMRRVLPKNPQTLFRDAQVTFLEGNSIRARELIQPLLRMAPDNLQLLELAGAVELNLNSLVQAESYLNRALSRSTDLPSVRRLLADILLRSGKPGKALEVLLPNIEASDSDSLSLSLAAAAYLQEGNFSKAESMFRQAASLAPNDSRIRAAVALTKLAKGQSESAFSDLRTIAASTQNSLADLALISALMKRNQSDEALDAIEKLERKQPGKPQAPNIRGRVLLMKRDLPGARRSFEESLKRDPLYFPAILNLASIEIAENRLESAEILYSDFLKANPSSAQAYVALAALKARRGAKSVEVTKLFEKAIQANPIDPSIRQRLIHHFISFHDFSAALSAAHSAVAALPDNSDLLEALGGMQVLTGDANQGILTLGKIASKYPNSVKIHLRLAEAYLQIKNFAAAERSFKRALELSPDSVNAQRGLIAMSVRARQPDRALALSHAMQRQQPSDSVGYLLEGDVHVEFKQWEQAIRAYRNGLTKTDSRQIAQRLYATLTASRGKLEGHGFANEWIKTHPNDSQFLAFLGNNAINSNDLPVAEQFLAAAIKINPKDASVTNNLAWVKAKQGKPGAIALAAKAVSMAPEDPALLDTLAFAQASENQLDKAIETAKSVLLIAPNVPLYQLNIARLYIRAGDKKSARIELAHLTRLGATFPRQREVGELLRTLN